MRTISQVVEQVMAKSPFYAEAIAEGIASNAKIARAIKTDVEKILYEKVSEEAIGMALHRMGKSLKRPIFGVRFLKKLSGIMVRSNLVELVCGNSSELAELVEEVSRHARHRRNAFINFSRGMHESLLILDAETEHELHGHLKRMKHVRRVGELSAITLRLPEESLAVPGLYYPILKALAIEGISFVEVMSVRTELTILFKDKDVDRAFSVLKRITSRVA
jgi:hypothetical protein